MAFVEVRFPDDISYGSRGGPAYSTDVVMSYGGHEQRNVNWAQARARYNVAHGVKTQAQLDALIAFFRARKGRGYGFRYKDWSDYAAAGQVLATANGLQKEFQLIKRYSSGEVAEDRVITKPVEGTVRVFFGAEEQESGWSVDVSTGVVSFDVAPPQFTLVVADFEFDVPVRFDTDRLSASLDAYGVHSWNDIPLVELRVQTEEA